jgi:hypothetical protein
VGHKLTVKANSSTVSIYDQSKEIVGYARSWEPVRTFGAGQRKIAVNLRLHRDADLDLRVHAGERLGEGMNLVRRSWISAKPSAARVDVRDPLAFGLAVAPAVWVPQCESLARSRRHSKGM